MADSWNKKEREKKKQQNQKAKMERKLERKEKSKDGNNLENMMAYLDEDGNLSSTPPDPGKKTKINAEDILIGVPKQSEKGPGSYVKEGIVTNYNEDKGYGFIKVSGTNESIFVHANELMEPIRQQDKVIFEMGKGPKGLLAMKVRLVR